MTNWKFEVSGDCALDLYDRKMYMNAHETTLRINEAQRSIRRRLENNEDLNEKECEFLENLQETLCLSWD